MKKNPFSTQNFLTFPQKIFGKIFGKIQKKLPEKQLRLRINRIHFFLWEIRKEKRGNPEGCVGNPEGYVGNPEGYVGNPEGHVGNPEGYVGNPDKVCGNPEAEYF